jgi:rare lipoprotein A
MSLLPRYARVLQDATIQRLRGLRLRRVPSWLGTALRQDCSGIASAFALSALLTACGTPAPKPTVERAESAALPAPAKPAPAKPAYALKKGGGYYQDDGPGDNPPEDLDAIPDAVPRAEPLHRFANNPYSVFGQDYVPLRTPSGYKARGIASWYGRKFHGQRTSSGEPYDMYGMTAAHATLPIPSYVRVTNPANGKSVVVRVNDRGPFHSGRLIDLSYTAAWKLGYIGNGSTLVDIEYVAPGSDTLVASAPRAVVSDADPIERLALADTAPAAPAKTAPGVTGANLRGAWLQLGAFGNPDNAEAFRAHLARELDWLGDRLTLQSAGKVVRVQAGPWLDRAEAENAAERIRAALGVKPLVNIRTD